VNRPRAWAKDACLARSDGLNTNSRELHPQIVASAVTARKLLIKLGCTIKSPDLSYGVTASVKFVAPHVEGSKGRLPFSKNCFRTFPCFGFDALNATEILQISVSACAPVSGIKMARVPTCLLEWAKCTFLTRLDFPGERTSLPNIL